MKFSRRLLERLVVINLTLTLFLILMIVCLASLYEVEIYRALRFNLLPQIQNSNLVTQVKDSFTSPGEHTLPTVELKISEKHKREIHTLVEKLKKIQVLKDSDKTWFPAKFYADNEEFDVKIRLRGDLSNHWAHDKKSWRVKFRKDHLYKGLREINFIIPDDKFYEVESVAYAMARRLGVLVPHSGFVNMKINSVPMGAYFWIEAHSQGMLEQLQYPPGEIYGQNNIWVETYNKGYGVIQAGKYQHKVLYNPGLFASRLNTLPIRDIIDTRWAQFLDLLQHAD